VRSAAGWAAPGCGRVAMHVHSCYVRRV
jgi:hypothetical protein